MKFLAEVSALEVKRTFVIADYITQGGKFTKGNSHIKDVSGTDFNKILERAKKVVLKLKEEELDSLISPGWPRRINAYNASQWFIAEAHPSELGVWTRAGNLPLRWTNESLAETAEKILRGFRRKSKSITGRPKHAISNILKIKTHLEQGEKYLYPIVFKTDTGTKGRRRLKKKMKGDIDDGCMRSIAMTMSGRSFITVYFGLPRTTTKH
ncbi:MAG: hypothetical protein RLZZ67_651 [Candidatus Parcubacteria bacterium]|jgi:hypothetical protein